MCEVSMDFSAAIGVKNILLILIKWIPVLQKSILHHLVERSDVRKKKKLLLQN